MKHLVFIAFFALALYGGPGFAQDSTSVREEAVSAHCQGASYTLVRRSVPKEADQHIDIQIIALEPVDLLWKTFSTIEFTYRCRFRASVKGGSPDSLLVLRAEMDILLFSNQQEAQNETHTNLVPVSKIHLPNKRPLYTALRKLKML